MSLRLFWKGFSTLLFPKECIACGELLLDQEDGVCTSCDFYLPSMDSALNSRVLVESKFFGKVDFNFALAVFDMGHSERVHRIIQNIKYKNLPKIAYDIGMRFGEKHKENSEIGSIDTIIPIPLHRRKEKERGYNQSRYFAEGLGKSLCKKVDVKSLKRKKYTSSQTHKDRLERYENVKDIFECLSPAELKDKHVLIVDDVVTTAATMVSAAHTLLDSCPCEISFLAIANA